ncbi:MAG TPA: 2-amino-4-hydroxy-6-hydroxymethyldihydropteridine diphosphokinase, partial [Casimicrobiaceae bacterium]
MGTRAFIALGSNLEHPRRQIAAALDALRRTRGIRVLAVSPNYVTAPIGGPLQPDYVNAVAEIET